MRVLCRAAAALLLIGVMVSGCSMNRSTSATPGSSLTESYGKQTAIGDKRVETKTPDSSLMETYWKLTAIGDRRVETKQNRPQAHLVLRAGEGRLKGSGGCNRITGSYTLSGSVLHFRQIATTRMMCPDMADEQALLEKLERVDRYTISGESMQLLEKGKAILSFEALYLP